MAATATARVTSASTLPRVSSPLALHSTSSFESSDEEDEQDEAGDGDSDDDEMTLDGLLQAAKNRAAARANAGASGSGSASANLQDEDLALAAVDTDALPAVYTRPAVPAQVFSKPIDVKGKGRAVAEDADPNDGMPPGVKDKWDKLPRAKRTKSQKRLDTVATSGKGWFDMPRRPLASLSDVEKREIQALRLSNAMDPKRFMRGEAKRDNAKIPEYFQMGYVVDSAQNARAGTQAPSQKINKASFLSSLMGDEKGKEWAKRKYAQVQEKAQSGGKGFYKRKMEKRGSTGGGFGGKGKGKGKKRG